MTRHRQPLNEEINRLKVLAGIKESSNNNWVTVKLNKSLAQLIWNLLNGPLHDQIHYTTNTTTVYKKLSRLVKIGDALQWRGSPITLNAMLYNLMVEYDDYIFDVEQGRLEPSNKYSNLQLHPAITNPIVIRGEFYGITDGLLEYESSNDLIKIIRDKIDDI